MGGKRLKLPELTHGFCAVYAIFSKTIMVVLLIAINEDFTLFCYCSTVVTNNFIKTVDMKLSFLARTITFVPNQVLPLSLFSTC